MSQAICEIIPENIKRLADEVIMKIINEEKQYYFIEGKSGFGKTCVLDYLKSNLLKQHKNSKFIYIECRDVKDEVHFFKLILSAIYGDVELDEAFVSKSKARKLLEKEKYKNLESILAGIYGIGPWPDILKMVLDHVQMMCENGRVVFLLDNLDKFPRCDAFLEILVRQIEKDPSIILIGTGTKPLALELFEKRKIGVPDEKNIKKYMKKRFKAAGIVLDDQLTKEIWEKSNRYFPYLKLFCTVIVNKLYELPEQDRGISEGLIEDAYNDVLDHFDPLFKSKIPNSNTEFNILKYISKKNVPVSSVDISRKSGIPVGELGTFLKRLKEEGKIKRVSKGKYELSDLMFRDWLAEQPTRFSENF